MHDICCIQTNEASPFTPAQVRRLQTIWKRAGLKTHLHVPAELDPLTARSYHRIYLIAAKQLMEASWAGLRTRLAAANRSFLVAGESLSSKTIVQACRDGAFDVLDFAKDDANRWAQTLRATAEAQRLWWQLYGGQSNDEDERGLIGHTQPMKALRMAIQRLGPTQASVLILGESGTGKERVAQALHDTGGTGDFVAFNCAAVPGSLLEAELFGVTKGAFTGASADRPGLVEQADGGTLFLDEIGEMDPTVQPKLLRFLETRRARRLGANRDYEVNLRVVAATNRDLDREMATQGFRADLFFRLAEITLELAPLRARLEDLPPLTRHFLGLAGERFGKFFDSIEPDLILKFQGHPWPGNIRELKNTIDRLVLLHDGPVLRAGWWDPPVSPATLTPGAAAPAPSPAFQSSPPAGTLPPLRTRRDRLQRARQLLDAGQHNLAEVAAEIGVHPSTLFRWRQAGKV